MNGLIITHNFKPKVGGIQEYTHQMARYLNQLGERVVVLAPCMKGDSDFDASCGYPVVRFPWPMARSRNPFRLNRGAFLRLIYSQAKEIDAHYLLCNHWKSGLGINTLLASKLLGLPYFIFAYGSELVRPIPSRIKRWQRPLIYKTAACVYSISRYTQEKVRELGARNERLEIVPCGFDVGQVDNWPGLSRDRYSKTLHETLSPERKIILTVCRLEKRKGIDKVIEAMPLIRQSIPNAIYLVGGKGPYRPNLQKMVRQMGLEECVRFLGYLTEDEKFACYENCAVFVMPSRILPDGDMEGFGIVFLEANAFRKPVIGGRCGGVPDAIVDGETGFLVDPENVEEIADFIVRVLTNRDLARRLGENGRRHVEQVLTWENAARKMLASIHRAVRSQK